jgi:sec-independent protein translocase protein TatB
MEILFILLLALVVFGPERLPGLARGAGRWIGRARRFSSDLQRQVEKELAAEELRKAVVAARDSAVDR